MSFLVQISSGFVQKLRGQKNDRFSGEL